MADVIINRPNFLFSEVGKLVKTYGLDAVTNASIVTNETDADGYVHKIIKQGSIFKANGTAVGLVYQDIEVTGTTANTQVPASIMIQGNFINDTTVLPALVAGADLTTLEDKSLHAHAKVDVDRGTDFPSTPLPSANE